MDDDPFGLSGAVLADRYELEGCLAQGRTGIIYEARDQRTGRDVAIKVLRPSLCESAKIVDKFLAEVRVAASIRHAGVVGIHGVGKTANGWVFAVMDRVRGEDLWTYLRHTGPLPWSRVRPLALQLCHAVDAGHRQGVVHRFLTPGRCLRIVDRQERERIKVLGFGITSAVAGRKHASTGFAAPEQISGGAVDRRADVYAVGAILYTLLTARRPEVDGLRPMPLDEVHVRPVRALLRRALEPNPARRYVDLVEFADAIDRVELPVDADLESDPISGEFVPSAVPDGRPLRRGDSLADGRYEIVRRIGQGGVGCVWLAVDHEHRAHVVVKALHDGFAVQPERVTRFRDAVARTASLTHPAILRVLREAVEEHGHHYFVMELVEGFTLRDAVLGGRVEPEDAPAILRVLADALSDAHEAGCLHEDLSPASVFIDTRGRPRIAEFGLVRVTDTSTGKRTGTIDSLPFVAPEVRVDADDVSVASDVFSLGALAVFILTRGELRAGDPHRTAAELPGPLASALTRATALLPHERPATALALASDLDQAARASELRLAPSATAAASEGSAGAPATFEGSAESSGPGVVFVPLSGSDFSIDQVLEDSSDAGEPAARPSDDEPAEERPPSAARVRLVAMLSTAVVLCLSSLWMVLAVRSLEGERAELRARARVCAVNQEHNP